MNLKSKFECRELINPFEGLETEFLQNKFFKKHLDMLVCLFVLCNRKGVCVWGGHDV